jgi:transcriptional regulator with XRE-family HTH domain
MAKDSKNQSLGDYIRDRRLALGFSLSDVAVASGLHFSYWSKLEAGHYEAPAPKYLQVIADTLKVDSEDLYALVGYVVPKRLPTFKPYLRAKYGDLPPEAVADLERYFELLRAYFGIPKDQPVFPPKPKPAAKPKSQGKPRRAA